MRSDSEFLRGLMGKAVRIVAVDERFLEPMPGLTLQEVSRLGVVAAAAGTAHFFPWHEIVEIHPAEEDSGELAGDEDVVQALLGVDSEP